MSLPPSGRAGLLFDLDGTLAQTEDLHHAAFNALLADDGRALDHAAFVRHVSGRSNEDITAYLFPGKDDAERERLAQRKEREFRALAADGVEATPGAHALLDWARARGIATGLVTNAPRENADLMLEVLRLNGAFDIVVSGAELAHSKPHPDPYLAALDALALDARRTVAVEDSRTGIAAARAAGLDVVAMAGAATLASVADSGAALTVEDMTDVRLYVFLADRLRVAL
ncbi:MAG: HAD-IA family hydrolase [Betaproteobacteria bacterium]